MKKILLFVAVAALTASCGNNTADKSADSIQADSTAIEDSTVQESPNLPDTAISDTLTSDADDPFLKAIPDPKELCREAVAAGTTGKYITSLGFKVTAPGEWIMKEGMKVCKIREIDPDFEKDNAVRSFEVTIIGDDNALEQYYQKALRLEKAGFGSNYSVEKKGDTVITKETE